ncbi:MAG: bifunctional diaminohydroxyphosphoribosylaminopyrimidine deaminase/5-amino-6-(5-phosphoribosylamino)uracil reductase RibD [Clostridia bacterium]|nr:bifunctional diaminohydroxyphosphoribosylaminopyrimidine deaminase/5-amino-6-(5-phosphoribosylamino)uracil reductase RibD [Deltaproteobacteria bacterium]
MLTEAHMRRALEEAQRGAGRTRPNPNVGCVIARGETVIATGFTSPAGGPHAEVMALRAAGTSARGADAYVTLEPCNHYGRTPPCTGALIEAGVGRVIVGMRDPHRVAAGGVEKLREAGVTVEVGLLEDECIWSNRAFLHFVGKRTPYTIVKIAQSLDGRVATRTGASQWITGKESRARGHALRNTCDAVAAGIGTVLADNPRLTTRIPNGRDPIRVIVDSQARTPVNAAVLPAWIAVGDTAPQERTEALAKAGATILTLPTRRGRIDLSALATELGKRDIVTLLVEGGPQMIGGLVDAKLVHEVAAFIAPMIIGGHSARSSVDGLGAGPLTEVLDLETHSVERAGSDVVITARVKSSSA